VQQPDAARLQRAGPRPRPTSCRRFSANRSEHGVTGRAGRNAMRSGRNRRREPASRPSSKQGAMVRAVARDPGATRRRESVDAQKARSTREEAKMRAARSSTTRRRGSSTRTALRRRSLRIGTQSAVTRPPPRRVAIQTASASGVGERRARRGRTAVYLARGARTPRGAALRGASIRKPKPCSMRDE